MSVLPPAHPCPTKCGRVARAGRLMCHQCWEQLPGPNKRRVLQTWARYSRDFKDYHALRSYRLAAKAAVEAVAR